MRLLDRYLSAEIVMPFLVGIAGFVLIEIGSLLFNGLIEAMIQSHTPIGLAIRVLFLKLPVFTVMALPIATLFGVSLGMSRLARESEVNAMRMAGVPLRRLLVPLLGVGLLISALDYTIEEKIAPAANARASDLIQRMWLQSSLPTIQADTFFHIGNRWFYLGSVEKTGENRWVLKHVMIYELRGGGYPVLTVAESAVTNGTDWVFRNWRSVDLISGSDRFLDASRGTLHLNQTPQQFLFNQHLAEDMSSTDLRAMIQRFMQGGVKMPTLILDYHLKFSIPLGCLVVVLVSMPLAVHFARSGSFVGVLLSIVLFFFYYNTYFLARLLGEQGLLPPIVAAWAHNVIFAVIGLVMLWREE